MKESILEILENNTEWNNDYIPEKTFEFVVDDIYTKFISEKKKLLEMLIIKMVNEDETKFHKNIVSRELMLLNLENKK